MRKISGKTVYEGIAFGKLYVRHAPSRHVVKCDIQSTKEEWGKVQTAKEKAQQELEQLLRKAQAEKNPSVPLEVMR